MKNRIIIVALLALLLISPALAVDTPRGIDGRVYALDGMTPVPPAVSVTFDNLDTGQEFSTRVGRGAPGRYSVSLAWTKNSLVRVTASNPLHSSTREIELSGIIHGFDLYLNMTLPNLPPEIFSEPETTAVQDKHYSYAPEAYDWNGDPLQHTLLSSPTGMLIDQDTGKITWLPGPLDVGSATVSYMVTDGTYEITQNYTITVENVNDPPEILTTPGTEIDQDSPYEYEILTQDLDGDSVSLFFTGPEEMVLEGSLLSWTPNASEVGSYEINVTASDNEFFVSQHYTLQVRDLPDAPQITSSPEPSVLEDTTYTYTVTANDLDNDILSYSVEGPGNMTMEGRNVYWTPDNEYVGWHNITVAVFDGLLTSQQSYSLEVVNVNDLPETNINIKVPVVRNLGLYKLGATDPDDDNITFTLVNGPSGLSISSEGVLKYAPVKGKKFTFTVSLDDGTEKNEFNISATLVRGKKIFSARGGGGLFEEYFEEEEPIRERLFRFSKFLRKLLLRAENIGDMEISRETPEIPMDKVVYEYFSLIPETDVGSVEKAEVEFEVDRKWLEKHNIDSDDVSLYLYSSGWSKQKTSIEEDEENAVYSARIAGFGLFAIAGISAPVLPAPTILEIPEPTTIIGVVKGTARQGMNIVIEDLDTGREYRTETGRGELRGIFQITIDDVRGHRMKVSSGERFLTGETSFIADESPKAIDLSVSRGILGITGRVVGGTGEVAVLSLLLLISLICMALFLRRRLIK